MSYREVFCKVFGGLTAVGMTWLCLDFALSAYEERNTRIIEMVSIETEARYDAIDLQIDAIHALEDLLEVGRAPRESGNPMSFEEAELVIISNLVQSLKMGQVAP